MKTIPEIPVLLLTGYLGSGKTTLLNRILQNERGIRFAVIVNDIGEVNIDAELIAQGGIVGQADDSLVALQNGCICCSLKLDLVKQLCDIMAMQRFDYIVIEASGICEPAPIAQTICSIPTMGEEFIQHGVPRLDCIATVVDALRLKDEFRGGLDFTRPMDEDDIEKLVVEQIEFCNKVLLNKASEVSPEELGRTEEVLRALQPKAEIIPCDYCDIDLTLLLNTRLFDFDGVATSATWIKEIEGHVAENDEEEHHHHEEEHHHHEEEHHHHEEEHHHHEEEHHHHHGPGCHCHHCHGEGHSHTEEYGISTFVYFARRPFNISLFDEFVARHWPKGVIRAKGMCWFHDEPDICYVFEQAGRQVNLRDAGQWYATMPPEELHALLENNPLLRERDWDEEYGDRMQKIVFIGQHMDQAAIKAALDNCLR
ncbi:MAG: GTP-binding protein [Bacteroidales bacterium]|nr:GTP-binding protein [Candidatus Equimonas faecalis]